MSDTATNLKRAYGEVFPTFLLLGCIAFGGPAAHIGFFRRHFVEQKQWLDEQSFAGLLALCQFLPGPASSQLGFAIGRSRAGLPGAIAAFIGFTLPAFVLMTALALFSATLTDSSTFASIVQGLKLLAVVVVADSVLSMSKSFCISLSHRLLALITATVLITIPGLLTQFMCLILAASVGAVINTEKPTEPAAAITNKPSYFPLLLFAVLFISLPILAHQSLWLELAADFYAAGSLVFGGGHVVLPLLQGFLGDSISADRFLTGYAGAQAIPGPMFSLAAFLGSDLVSNLSTGLQPAQALSGAAIATLAIFLPGFLLLTGLLPVWQSLQQQARVAAAVAGVNAAVVGLLLAALYSPVGISAIQQVSQAVFALFALLLLRFTRITVLMLLLLCIAAGLLL